MGFNSTTNTLLERLERGLTSRLYLITLLIQISSGFTGRSDLIGENQEWQEWRRLKYHREAPAPCHCESRTGRCVTAISTAGLRFQLRLLGPTDSVCFLKFGL